MIKPIIVTYKNGEKANGLIDTQRMLIYVGYMTTEFAKKLGYTWKECEVDEK